ncbi:MAG: flagellar filament capping protein FliD [Azoarcus sp.]|nr:flagellar filament capping protein FliD [Azoarcus sp.]
MGSGLDLESLVTGLMNVERQPLETLKTQLSSYNTKISALGTLTSKLSALQTAAKNLQPATLQTALDKFGTFTGKVGNESVAGVEAGTGAIAGSYSLEVSQLATAQKTSLKGLDASQQLDITVGGTTYNFTAASNTLESMANAVNSSDSGISATVVNDGSGNQYLVLTGKEGASNNFTVSGGATTGATETTIQNAQSAQFKLDGISITSESNTVKDAVAGVTLNLKATNAGSPTTVSVTADYGDKIKESLNAFVTAFNAVVSSVKSLGSYDSETGEAGTLNGHRVLRETQTALRSLVNEQSASGLSLNSLGITFTSDGTLSLDADKLAKAVANDPAAVANFTSEIGSRFNSGVDKLITTGGTVQSATDSLKTSVTNLEKRQTALETRLESVEARYRSQFSALDTLMASMNSTSSYLTQQLASLSSSSS